MDYAIFGLLAVLGLVSLVSVGLLIYVSVSFPDFEEDQWIPTLPHEPGSN